MEKGPEINPPLPTQGAEDCEHEPDEENEWNPQAEQNRLNRIGHDPMPPVLTLVFGFLDEPEIYPPAFPAWRFLGEELLRHVDDDLGFAVGDEVFYQARASELPVVVIEVKQILEVSFPFCDSVSACSHEIADNAFVVVRIYHSSEDVVSSGAVERDVAHQLLDGEDIVVVLIEVWLFVELRHPADSEKNVGAFDLFLLDPFKQERIEAPGDWDNCF